MCGLCSPETREAAVRQEVLLAQLLEEIARTCRGYARGELDPHGPKDACEHRRILNRMAVRQLAERI